MFKWLKSRLSVFAYKVYIRNGKVLNRPHSVSYERLAHFHCGACQRWWSIGDWQETEQLCCPHCGHKSEVIEL